jgi:methionine synthase II (cobalamin-independent)
MTIQDPFENRLPPFSATGIGSVPFLSSEEACHEILAHHDLVPFWPQLVQKNPKEDMILQYSPPLPCLVPDLQEKTLNYSCEDNRAECLLGFYEKYLSTDLSHFSLRPDFAEGFYRLLELLAQAPAPPPFLKGQIVGPVTFGLSVRLSPDRFLIHDSELMDTVIKALALEAVFQVRQFEKLTPDSIIFLDEPSLSGYGSAFTPLSKDEVLRILGETIGLIREQVRTRIGLHCCGNTDWSLLLSLDLDLINLDAFEFGPFFLLYPEEIKKFLDRDRVIAWGIVPTTGYTGAEKPLELLDRMEGYFKTLIGKGLDRSRLFTQAMLTPACGMGTLSEETARQLLNLLEETSRLAGERFRAD